MPTLTTQYVYFGASAAHTRQPRATTSYGGFTPIPTLNPSGTATLTTGTTFQAGPVEAALSIGGTDYAFAFQTVSGLNEGPQMSFVAATPPTAGTVGTESILVLVVYVPEGISPGGTMTGAVIDAFNESTGSLVDNDFVTVSPDPGGTLTTEANVDGWVDTTDAATTITADHPNIGPYLALPTNAVFDAWVVLTDPTPPTSLVSGASLTPGKGETVYALAFYANPKVVKTYLQDKPFKETIKELDKHPKEVIDIGKSAVTEGPIKGPKESVELPGFGNNPGDPGDLGPVVQGLSARIARLEAAARGAPKGAAFIKAKDRPPVGKSKTLKRRDS
jgi:hypothetical protein